MVNFFICNYSQYLYNLGISNILCSILTHFLLCNSLIMQIEFKTNKLKKDCEKWTCFKNNNELNAKVQQRIWELQAADCLLTIKKLPQLKLHSLTWKRRFELAIDISGRTNPYRIVFETLNWENVCDDWLNDEKFKTVTQVRILEITDYH